MEDVSKRHELEKILKDIIQDIKTEMIKVLLDNLDQRRLKNI